MECMNTCIYTKLVYTMKMPTPTGRSGIRWARLGRTLLLYTWPRVLTDQLKADCLRSMANGPSTLASRVQAYVIGGKCSMRNSSVKVPM